MARETTEHSFDELARGLAEGSISRRRALKLFVATALATVVPARLAGADDDDRECKERGQRCGGGRGRCCGNLQCREGRCRRPRTTTTSTTTSTSTSTTSTSTTPGCLPNGATCTAETLCCSGTVCANGECCTPNSDSANPIPCTADSECCSGICNRSGTISVCFFCREPGGSCTSIEDCCSKGGACIDGTCCQGPNGTCTTDTDCCTGICRADGTCAPL
jgi:hypothetical protein